MKKVHVYIHGDVIGVGFRAWTVRQARDLNVVGWVKNRADRTVEVVAVGKEEQLRDFVKRCQRGPEVAWVERVEEQWEDLSTSGEEFVDFRVTY